MDHLAEITAYFDTRREALNKLAGELWRQPETAFKEHRAAALLTAALKTDGFRVEHPYCGLDTAFRAEAGDGAPVFAVAAEYDALPGLGHACGHNLIAAAAVGAAGALKTLLERHRLPGQVVVLGTPGEESGGGKVVMLEHGCLDDVDAVMMVHPSWRTTPDTGSSAIRRFDVVFHGRAAHAAAAPELGENALDAVMLLFAGINAWRQQLPESCRIHGIVTEGGDAPNIIPARASCRFFLRAADATWLSAMDKRFRQLVRGAALMTATRSRLLPFSHPYLNRKPNRPLNEVYLEAAEKLGLAPVRPKRPGRGSSDFGNFSQIRPGIHPYFGIAAGEIAAHSREFAAAADSDHGKAQMLKAAAAMAATGFRYFTDDAFRRQVAADFNRPAD